MTDVNGVVMLVISKSGTVLASVSDFDTSGYGGFTLEEAQTIRANRALAYEYLRAVAHPHLAEAVRPMDAERILKDVCDKHGYKIIKRVIGHGERQP
jgi:hypothetical protein